MRLGAPRKDGRQKTRRYNFICFKKHKKHHNPKEHPTRTKDYSDQKQCQHEQLDFAFGSREPFWLRAPG
jgi:hypothetical protein